MPFFALLYLASMSASTSASVETLPAAPPVSAEAGKTTAAVEPDGVVICKRFPAPTGSRIGKRQICKTKWQWDQEKADNATAIDKVQRNPGKPAF